MDFTLVVVQPFGPHGSGDAITDPDGIAAVLDGEHADKVVRLHADGITDEGVRLHADAPAPQQQQEEH